MLDLRAAAEARINEAVPVGRDVFGSVSAISVLRDVIGGACGWSMMGDALNANAVPMPVDVICCLNTMSVQVDRIDGVSAILV
jgi:hypothetical protein